MADETAAAVEEKKPADDKAKAPVPDAPTYSNVFLVNNSTSMWTDSGTGSGGIYLNPSSLTFDPMSSEDSIRLGTPAGTQIESKRSKVENLNPRLYFKYVKSKLSKVEVDKLKPRIARLRGLAQDAIDAGQTGLYEKMLMQLAVMIREQEADVAGYGTFVWKRDIEKFKPKVQGRVVELCRLEEFPRVLPKPVQAKLKAVREAGVFDEFWVLHTNLTGEKAKTTAKKIKEKDPILFGTFAYEKDGRFFYVTDWIDEYCDLTFSEFTRMMKGVDKEYRPSELREPTDDEVKAILEEVKTQHKNWTRSNGFNYRDVAKDSENVEHALGSKPEPLFDAVPVPVDEPEPAKKPWWRFW